MGVSSLHDCTSRIPALDGIRGLAIGLVLVWHGVFNVLVHIPNHPQAARILALGRLTWSGVDLFFVLSGFLIGGILLDAAKAERYFTPFYIRRAHRILPLYGLVLVLVYLGSYTIGQTQAMNSYVENRIPLTYYATFLQNFWTARHQDFGSYTLGVTWSLAIEEQFYLTLPAVVRFVGRARLAWIAAAMLVLAPVLRIVLNRSLGYGPLASYVLMPCRLDSLGLGLAAALLVRTPKMWDEVMRHRKHVYVALVMAGFGVVLMLLFGFTAFTNQILGLEYSVLAVLYFLLLLGVLTSNTLNVFFSSRVLRYMGIRAYGLYLLHVPCMVIFFLLFARIHPAQSGWITLGASLSGIALACGLAAFSWEFLEKPLIKRGHRWNYGDPTTSAERGMIDNAEAIASSLR